MSDCTRERNDLSEQAEAAEHGIRRRQEAVAGIERDRARASGRLAAVQERGPALEAEVARADARRERLRVELDQILAAKLAAQVQRQVAEDALERIHRELAAQADEVAALGDQQAGALRRLATLREERSSLESRLRLLDEMAQLGEGLDEAVKRVLAEREKHAWLAGMLGDLIETDASTAALIEAALGDHLQTLIVRRADDLGAATESVRGLEGRVRLAAPVGTVSLPAGTEEATPLLQSVRCPADVRPVVETMLGHCFRVADLPTALRLAGSEGFRGCTLVSACGAVVEGAGRVRVTGSRTARNGVLSRRVERGDLEATVSALSVEISMAEGELGGLNEAAAAAARAQQELDGQMQQAMRQRMESQYQGERQDQLAARIRHDQDAAAAERAESERRLRELHAERESSEARLKSFDKLLDEERRALETMQASVSGVRSALQSAIDRLAAARTRASEANAVLDGRRRERRLIEVAIEGLDRQRAELGTDHERRAARSEELARQAAEAQHQREAAMAAEATARDQAQEIGRAHV